MPETIVIDLAYYNSLHAVAFAGIGFGVFFASFAICKYLDKLFDLLNRLICSKCLMRGGDNGKKQQKYKVPDNEKTW